MAGINELDKFVYKFKSLLESGSDAKLIVNAERGIAKISLHVNVQYSVDTHVKEAENSSRRNGGVSSPCRQRRRLRREAKRNARAAAAEAEKAKVVENDPELKKAEMSEAEYELLVETQEEVTNYEITLRSYLQAKLILKN